MKKKNNAEIEKLSKKYLSNEERIIINKITRRLSFFDQVIDNFFKIEQDFQEEGFEKTESFQLQNIKDTKFEENNEVVNQIVGEYNEVIEKVKKNDDLVFQDNSNEKSKQFDIINNTISNFHKLHLKDFKNEIVELLIDISSGKNDKIELNKKFKKYEEKIKEYEEIIFDSGIVYFESLRKDYEYIDNFLIKNKSFTHMPIFSNWMIILTVFLSLVFVLSTIFLIIIMI